MLIFLTMPHWIVALYDQKEEVRDLAIRLLMISGLFQFFDGFQVVGMGGLRGLKQGRFAFAATTICFWFIGLGTVLWFYSQGSPIGIWVGLLVGLAAASIAHHTRLGLTLRPA